MYRSGRGTIWRSGRILPIYEAWITRKAEEEGQVMDGPPRACENQCEKAFLNHHVCNMIGATSCNSLFIVDWSPLHHSSFIAAQFCEPHTPYTYELWRIMLSAYQPTGSILQFIVVRVTFVVTDQRGRGALAPSIIPPVLYRPNARAQRCPLPTARLTSGANFHTSNSVFLTLDWWHHPFNE